MSITLQSQIRANIRPYVAKYHERYTTKGFTWGPEFLSKLFRDFKLSISYNSVEKIPVFYNRPNCWNIRVAIGNGVQSLLRDIPLNDLQYYSKEFAQKDANYDIISREALVIYNAIPEQLLDVLIYLAGNDKMASQSPKERIIDEIKQLKITNNIVPIQTNMGKRFR